jgi:methionyl-tRNA synthetase
MEPCEFHKGLAAVWQLISLMNRYIDTHQPWVLAKDDSCRDRLAAVIYNLLESLRVVAALIYPVMPGTTRTMQQVLGVTLPENRTYFKVDELMPWKQMVPGEPVAKPGMLFPRIT